MDDSEKENVVLTPKCKTANSTILVIERCVLKEEPSEKNNVHVAGGEHRGIIVNKTASQNSETMTNPDISLEFRVYLVNAQTGAHTQESRNLKFWFKSSVLLREQSSIAQHMFRDLVSPNEFPRDYVGFIKKIMKLMQKPYVTIKKIEIELKQIEEGGKFPKTPLSGDESLLDKSFELSEQKLLEVVESSYPNPVIVRELSIRYSWEEKTIIYYLTELQNKGLVKSLDHGAFTRVTHDDIDVQIVKQMPTIVSAKQPTIAIITAQYCEKVAVDALIENKETYVRYTTVGESNIYTLGNIGQRRVVCTKLPTVGHTREAMIAAGNTTTRLLGTFQKVDYVILVGVGGGVPHYTDYKKHVRLGDVVISHATDDIKYAYTYCENAKYNQYEGLYEFETKEYCPSNLILQEIAEELKTESENDPNKSPWLYHLGEVQKSLQENGLECVRPSEDSDKLYMCIGDRAIIEVAHPLPLDRDKSWKNLPRIHLGPIASGRAISKNEQLRQAFALHSSALAFDLEFDSVIESIIGSCRESFAVVRGIADYRDGTKRSEWQAFASASAAAVVKSIICTMNTLNL